MKTWEQRVLGPGSIPFPFVCRRRDTLLFTVIGVCVLRFSRKLRFWLVTTTAIREIDEAFFISTYKAHMCASAPSAALVDDEVVFIKKTGKFV